MFPKGAPILLAGLLLTATGCGGLEWLSPSYDPQRDFLLAQWGARSFAEAEVADRHACNDGETLLSGFRDYEKQGICSMCKKGQTFVATNGGGGVYTCSACGSGDVVTKLSADERKTWCDALATDKQLEEKDRHSNDELVVHIRELLPLAISQAETNYKCRAGDQSACSSEEQRRENERLAETRAQTAALNSQAQAGWAQAREAQQANFQREREAEQANLQRLVPSPPVSTTCTNFGATTNCMTH